MRTNVRIGNDIKLLWEVLRGGYPVNFNNATDIKVSILQGGKYSCEDKTEISTFEIDSEQNNLLNIEIQADKITELGYLWVVLEYTIGDHGLVDGNRKITIDNLPVKIVGLSDEAGQVFEFEVTSDVVVGFDGKSAYEVWLVENPDKTLQDYFDWLQQPATDAVSLIDAKIDELDTAIQQEEQRELAEGVRLSNEQSRVEAEGLRVSGEVARNTAEGIRVGNESTRIDNEGIRLLAEEDRIDAEETRVENETLRISAELSRKDAENLRATAESSRELAESLRVEAELLRQSSTQEAILNAENATENANTAAQNADDARLAIQDDLALKADQADLAQLESDVEQLAYVKIKNEVVNGNLENGLIEPFRRIDSGGGASTLTINSSTPISGNYDVRLTITTPTTDNNRPIFWGLHRAANIGDKIYLHFYAKILSGTPAIRSIHDGVGVPLIYGGDVINGRNTRIIDIVDTGDNAGVIYFNSKSVWDMQMDNFMRINLTETFGAGNEPTEEEMNLLLDIAGISYINDEVIIPAQKVMQWQLKLIRKNKNAIIALGGTII